MILAGLVEIFLGVKAERRGLEDIARPLTAQDTGREHPHTSIGMASGGGAAPGKEET
jgi:hypothetical protein